MQRSGFLAVSWCFFSAVAVADHPAPEEVLVTSHRETHKIDVANSNAVVADSAALLRKAPGAPPVAVISNMTPAMHGNYRLRLPRDGTWREIVNSDAEAYGGSGKGNLGQVKAEVGAANLVLPPLATIMLEFEG